MIYFKAVQHNQELQQQIINYSFVIPVGLILAVEGYVGYIVVKTVRELQENKKIKRMLSNVIILGMRMFHKIATQMIDIIAIIITSLAFFIYSSPYPTSRVFNIMDISDMYFIIFVPSIGIITYLLIYKRKLEYR
jgi:hypothetical protein